MKFFHRGKDGGDESTVWGLWLIESKTLFSIALLKFVGKSREAFHTHAFNSISWVLKGKLTEHVADDSFGLTVEHENIYRPSWKPIYTSRRTFHKVDSDGTTVVLTLRGPWINYWREYLPLEKRFRLLTHGRREIA